jgi:hypothetical protein
MDIREIFDIVFERKNGKYVSKIIKQTYTENREFIEYCLGEQNQNTFYAAMIMSLYSSILTEEKSYKKVLPYLNRIITVWEEISLSGEENELRNDWYRELRFCRGKANYWKNKFNEAKNDFNWLVNNYPDNDVYNEWRADVRNRQLENTAGVLLYCGCFFVVLVLFSLPGDKTGKIIIGTLGASLSFASFILNAIVSVKRRRIKN